jgi:predicted nucleic-acid-binding Zn-ribbon protein
MFNITKNPINAGAILSAENLTELEKAMEIALPNLACLVCSNKSFILRDVFEGEFENQLRSRQMYISLQNFFPAKAAPIIHLSCDKCGYIMQFDEDRVLQNAGLTAPSSESGS